MAGAQTAETPARLQPTEKAVRQAALPLSSLAGVASCKVSYREAEPALAALLRAFGPRSHTLNGGYGMNV
jgi:hypothetical protein